MKKKIISTTIVVMVIALICVFLNNRYKNNDTNRILLNTWKQLEKTEKNEIGNYQNGTVEIVQIPNEKINENTYKYKFTYNNKKVYLVTFKSNKFELLGSICRLVDIDSGSIIGFNIRN